MYHITGEGQDGGVVYCEMQGRENTGESRTHLELLRSDSWSLLAVYDQFVPDLAGGYNRF